MKLHFLLFITSLSLLISATASQDDLIRCGGKGRLAIVDAAPHAKLPLADSVRCVENLLQISAFKTNGVWSLTTADAAFRATGADLAIFVIADQKLPISLVAMEGRWAMVNAAGLSAAGVNKEICRAVAAIFASQPSPVFSRAELESKDASGLSLANLLPVLNGLETYGFEQYSLLSYREACENGIAPAPANDEQRKIAAEFKKQ